MNDKSWTHDGAYTPATAAALLGVNTAKILRWVYGTTNAEPAIVPQHRDFRGEIITFLDLIQAMAIRNIRNQRSVSLQKIRATVIKAREYGILYPLAKKHTTFVFNDDVVLRLDDGSLIQATGRYHDNQLIEPVVYEYLDDLGWDDRGFASAYRPIRRGYRLVTLDPRINYGAPTVMPCRYTVTTLLNAVESEGDENRAAAACGVHPIDVQLAREFEVNLAA